MKRLYRPDLTSPNRISITPETASWKFLSFRKAPGTNAYYLNFLAGDVRRISAVNDPEYDWVATNWGGNPIPVRIGAK